MCLCMCVPQGDDGNVYHRRGYASFDLSTAEHEEWGGDSDDNDDSDSEDEDTETYMAKLQASSQRWRVGRASVSAASASLASTISANQLDVAERLSEGHAQFRARGGSSGSQHSPGRGSTASKGE